MKMTIITALMLMGSFALAKDRKPNQSVNFGKDAANDTVFNCTDDEAVDKACEAATWSVIQQAEKTGKSKVSHAYRTAKFKYQGKPVCLSTLEFSDRTISIYHSNLMDIGEMTGGTEGAGKCFFETVGSGAQKVK